jgi:hypothetical protein
MGEQIEFANGLFGSFVPGGLRRSSIESGKRHFGESVRNCINLHLADFCN